MSFHKGPAKSSPAEKGIRPYGGAISTMAKKNSCGAAKQNARVSQASRRCRRPAAENSLLRKMVFPMPRMQKVEKPPWQA